MSEQEELQPSAADLSGGARQAEAPEDFGLPTGELLAMRPFGHRNVEINGKEVDSVDVYVIEVGEEGLYEDHGIRNCSWQFVIRELDKCNSDEPWCVGTVEKKSRAYFVIPPYPEEFKNALDSIASLVADREREEAAAEPF